MDELEYKCIELRHRTQDVLTVCSNVPMHERIDKMNDSAIELKELLMKMTRKNETECSALAIDIAIGRRSYDYIYEFLVCA